MPKWGQFVHPTRLDGWYLKPYVHLLPWSHTSTLLPVTDLLPLLVQFSLLLMDGALSLFKEDYVIQLLLERCLVQVASFRVQMYFHLQEPSLAYVQPQNQSLEIWVPSCQTATKVPQVLKCCQWLKVCNKLELESIQAELESIKKGMQFLKSCYNSLCFTLNSRVVPFSFL